MCGKMLPPKYLKFADSVTIFVKAGDGGDGCVSFRREKYVPKGGPDGGDGGKGGNVILVGNKHESSLIHLYYSAHLYAESGKNGGSKGSHGKNGKDLRVYVPCGTEVWDTQTNELIADIIEDGQEIIIAHGGAGGKGNIHWKSPTNRAPQEFTRGTPGEEKVYRLELKLIADAGLVGFPNAGKSSILKCISKASPKIANYQFTTLVPNIGTIIYPDYTYIKVADLPGIVEGAHRGKGLGVRFLKHIERARVFVIVIDISGEEGRNPWDDYFILLKELKSYKEELIYRPRLTVANKMDLKSAKKNLKTFIEKTGIKPIPCSTVTRLGLKKLKSELYRLIVDIRKKDKTNSVLI